MRDSLGSTGKSDQCSKSVSSRPVYRPPTLHLSPLAHQRAPRPKSPLAMDSQPTPNSSATTGSPMVVRRESPYAAFWGSSIKQTRVPRPPSPVPARRNRSSTQLAFPALEPLDESDDQETEEDISPQKAEGRGRFEGGLSPDKHT